MLLEFEHSQPGYIETSFTNEAFNQAESILCELGVESATLI